MKFRQTIRLFRGCSGSATDGYHNVVVDWWRKAKHHYLRASLVSLPALRCTVHVQPPSTVQLFQPVSETRTLLIPLRTIRTTHESQKCTKIDRILFCHLTLIWFRQLDDLEFLGKLQWNTLNFYFFDLYTNSLYVHEVPNCSGLEVQFSSKFGVRPK